MIDYRIKRYLFKGWGLTLWWFMKHKVLGFTIPQITLHFGGMNMLSFNTVFHSGRGVELEIRPLIIFRWAYDGCIIHYENKKFNLYLFNKRVL